jgi:hypothetical protein
MFGRPVFGMKHKAGKKVSGMRCAEKGPAARAERRAQGTWRRAQSAGQEYMMLH